MNNVKQFKKYYHGMSVMPPLPSPPLGWIVVNNIIYLFCETMRCLENKKLLKNPIVIYDSRLFEVFFIKVPKIIF
jgi:hypothetical protein